MKSSCKSRRVVIEGEVRPATLLVEEGRIAAIVDHARAAEVDYGDRVILPGLVDTHVHLNEPGRTDWEGFASGTAAAAAGGITTLVDMPLNSVPSTLDPESLERKRAAARGQLRVDLGYWGGATPGNLDALEALQRAGALGFKAFMIHAGTEDFDWLPPDLLEEACRRIAGLGAVLLVHAECPLTQARLAPPPGAPTRYQTWLASRPPEVEVEAVRAALAAAERTGCRLHVVHVSAAEALPRIAAARAAGLAVTAETCPHYLCLEAEEVPDGATAFKCAPPIRGRANRELLWEGLKAGTLQLVVSDHSPSPGSLRTGSFLESWGGIASLQLGLPLVWTEGRGRGVTFPDLARWMSAAPAALAGLSGRKGAIRPGMDADLAIFDPDGAQVVGALLHRHPLTPYLGRRLRGEVVATWLRGRVVWGEGRLQGEPWGQELLGGAPGRGDGRGGAG